MANGEKKSGIKKTLPDFLHLLTNITITIYRDTTNGDAETSSA
jgi:hypothetical protein